MSADLEPDDDERLLRDAVERALSGLDASRAFADDDVAAAARVPARHWDVAREMGWPGLLIDEAAGGQGMRHTDLAILAEAMGRHLFSGPFLGTAVLAPALARLPAAAPWATTTLSAIARSEMAIALAWLPARDPPAGLRWDDGHPARLSGARELVEHRAIASHVLVLDIAASGDHVDLVAGLVDGSGPGLRWTDRQAFDVTCPVARLDLDGAPLVADGLLRVRLTRAEHDALLRPLHVAIAAELVGVARAALARAIEHATTREQFGSKIGAFQAIKHRLADAFVAIDSAGLAVRHAALDADDPLAAPIARVLASEAALRACGDCIQVQGGLGFSWESDAHLLLKRARRLAVLLAEPAALRQRIAELFVRRTLAAA